VTFSIAAVDQMVKMYQLVETGPVSCRAKYIVLPILPCEVAIFKVRRK